MLENLKNVQKKTFKNLTSFETDAPQYYDMIVFCHFRWQFITQCPEHIISRMAKTMKTLYIEEPLHYNEDGNSGKLTVVNQMLHILQPNVKHTRSIARILPKFVRNKNIPIGWFYSASFYSLLETMFFETVIYNSQDELSLVKGVHLRHQEKYLIAEANMIFADDKSSNESKKKFNANVYRLPSWADGSHFVKALNGSAISENIAHLQSSAYVDTLLEVQTNSERKKNIPRQLIDFF